jgi:hypothetical protein
MRPDYAGVWPVLSQFGQAPKLAQTVPFGGSLLCDVPRVARFTKSVRRGARNAARSRMKAQWNLPGKLSRNKWLWWKKQ